MRSQKFVYVGCWVFLIIWIFYCMFILSNILLMFVAVGALCIIIPSLAIYPMDLERSTKIWGVKKTFAYTRYTGVIMMLVFAILFFIDR